MIRFANPWYLSLIALIPFMAYMSKVTDRKGKSFLRFSDKGALQDARPAFKVRASRNMIYLRGLSLLFIILAFARPQSATEHTKVHVEGVEIVLAVDVSGSMKAMDFEVKGKKTDRLEAVKNVVADFVDKRPSDRIGVVVFAGLAYTLCPLTLDHDWLKRNLERASIGMVEDGTAIGTAIIASLNRLRETPAKEKIIVLLTDGRNNAGRISPVEAAEAAKALGVKVYTIAMGTRGLAPFPVKDMFGNTVLKPVEIPVDEELLEKIADTTGARYFRGNDTASLNRIYNEIDRLEKTTMEETGYSIYHELFGFFLIPGIIIFFLEIILSGSIFRRIP